MSSLPHPDPHYCAFFFFFFFISFSSKGPRRAIQSAVWAGALASPRTPLSESTFSTDSGGGLYTHLWWFYNGVSLIKRPQIRVDQKKNVQEINKAEVTQRASGPPPGPPSCGSPCKHAAGSQLFPALSPTFPSSFLHRQPC